MSEYNDIAGSDDIITLNCESQETFNDHSYRTKQSASRIEKILPIKGQAKENQKPIEQDEVIEIDDMQTETQNYSLPLINNGAAVEQPPPSIDTQDTLTSNNPFIIQPPLAQSTLTDGSSISADKETYSLPIPDEKNTVTETASKTKLDSKAPGLDTSTTANKIRLYISPSTSLLETTNVDDIQLNPVNASTIEIDGKNQEEELNDKPKEEPMDTSDAQASLGSDGLIESHPITAPVIESTTVKSPTSSRSAISPASKYALSQPATNKFEEILAKLTTSPTRQAASSVRNETESNVTIREEEELCIKESILKTVRRYAVKTDQSGRTVSRELLNERIVEENTITRIEPWAQSERKKGPPTSKVTQPTELAQKKPTKAITTKAITPKRRTKSLKPTSTVITPKKSKTAHSDDDEVSKNNPNEDTSDVEETDSISGDEFVPPTVTRAGSLLVKGSRVFAKWTDDCFYPGIIGNITGEKFMIDYDDGARRYVKANEIISQSYLQADQAVMAQTQDGYSESGIVKRIIRRRNNGELGYVVEKDGKEKWYQLYLVSLTPEQAEHLPIAANNTESNTNAVQGKRKRTSTVPQSPKKKTKSSNIQSPNKSQRSTYTPTRQTKLFNNMHFLVSGFNNLMNVRQKVQDSIESHGGKVIEKIPNANRRDNVYLISDMARKTAKFFDAKKLNIPCVNYKWINQSVEKSDIQDWETYNLVLTDKETKTNDDDDDDDDDDVNDGQKED